MNPPTLHNPNGSAPSGASSSPQAFAAWNNSRDLCSRIFDRVKALWFLGALLGPASPQFAQASTAYGTLNNFDCVNDTGVEAHGFEIELEDVHSTDITYTYDYNHYGIPKIEESSFVDPDSGQTRTHVTVRYAATMDSSGNWTAFTAIPSGPISPTDGHQFTNSSVNFGGEHFGVGYYGLPTAVKYHWLIDDNAGNLIPGPPVYVATPTFAFYPPEAGQPAQVQAVIAPPPPPEPPVLEFGEATWVKDIKTTTHNANKVALVDLVDPDPEGMENDWRNGEPDEVETEWRLLQTEFANPDNPNGALAGAPEDLPEGDEVITRRYEFYKYTGPVDGESGEAMADEVAPDGKHGVGSVTFNSYIDPATGEWIEETVDLSTVEVVGDFIGAQMSGFDVAPALGLIDHIPDGEFLVPYADRRVVIPGDAAFLATISSGMPPDGTVFDELTGIFSGTPTSAGVFTFTVDASDTTGAFLSRTYTVTIPAGGIEWSIITTSAFPADGGSTTGEGNYENGTPVTVVATHNPGYAFVNWTEGGIPVSDSDVYPFTVNGDRDLVANFVAVYEIATSVDPASGGSASGDGFYDAGASVTVLATANPGYDFAYWAEGAVLVSSDASYTFTAESDRDLVAHFQPVLYTVTTGAEPAGAGSTTGDGTYQSGDNVTVSARANPGFTFVEWREGGTSVSFSSDYSFLAESDRDLIAYFGAPSLVIGSVVASRTHKTVTVSVTLENIGMVPASAAAINGKKDATLRGKGMVQRTPVNLGDLAAAGGAATAELTFKGIKAGTHALELTVEYTEGTAVLSTLVDVP